MHVAFIDESERDEDFYFLGALVCDETSYQQISRGLDSLLWEHSSDPGSSVTLGHELHGHALMQGIGVWKRVPLRQRAGIFLKALNVVADSDACMHIEGVDVNAQKARGSPSVTPARELAFSHLLERINDCARAKNTVAHIYADEHHSAEESRSQFSAYQIHGTYGYKSSRLEKLMPPIRFIDSRRSRALQAADLFTYLYNRDNTVNESDARAVELKSKMVRTAREAWQRGSTRIWP